MSVPAITPDAGADMLRVRVGDEHFALPLAGVEEALECPALAPVPGGVPELLGAFPLRGRILPVFAPDRALGVSRGARDGVVLVLRAAADRRVGLLVDDVEDVIRIDRTQLVRSPHAGTPTEVVLGVARMGLDLVAVVDAAALLAACRAARDVEDV